MKRLRKGDRVVIISGKDKGIISDIKRIVGDKAVVDNVNIVSRHTKNPSGDQGSIVKKEMPIHQSNIALYNPNTKRQGKIKFVLIDGKKHRYFKSDDTKVNS